MAHDFSFMNRELNRTFGQSVTYTPAGGSAMEMTAIPGEPAERESSTPGNVVTLWFNAADFSAPPAIGDVVRLGAADFAVERIDSDLAGGFNVWARRKS